MSEFKYIVGQEVVIESKDRNINGQRVRIASRHHSLASQDGEPTNFYKVSGGKIKESLSFFENQLIA